MPVLEYDEMAKTEVDEEYIRILGDFLKYILQKIHCASFFHSFNLK